MNVPVFANVPSSIAKIWASSMSGRSLAGFYLPVQFFVPLHAENSAQFHPVDQDPPDILL